MGTGMFCHSDFISEFPFIYTSYILFTLYACVYVWVLAHYSEPVVIRGQWTVSILPFHHVNLWVNSDHLGRWQIAPLSHLASPGIPLCHMFNCPWNQPFPKEVALVK